MTIAIKTASSDDQVVRLKVSWEAYEALVESLGDHSSTRLTYDGEILEIMSPGSTHEFLADIVSQMLTIVVVEWQIPLTGVGSTTFRTKPRGFEADRTYYVNAKARLRDIKNIDIAIDPPPDLLVEIDIASGSDDKLATYAGIGVPEVWRYNPEGFAAFALIDGQYVQIEVSRIISGLPLIEISNRLENSDEAEEDIVAFITNWQQWLRNNYHLHTSL